MPKFKIYGNWEMDGFEWGEWFACVWGVLWPPEYWPGKDIKIAGTHFYPKANKFLEDFISTYSLSRGEWDVECGWKNPGHLLTLSSIVNYSNNKQSVVIRTELSSSDHGVSLNGTQEISFNGFDNEEIIGFMVKYSNHDGLRVLYGSLE